MAVTAFFNLPASLERFFWAQGAPGKQNAGMEPRHLKVDRKEVMTYAADLYMAKSRFSQTVYTLQAGTLGGSVCALS